MRGAGFYLREFAGALGDLPLFLVFLVALFRFSNLNPLPVLFWSGVIHIVVGLLFRLPLPLQPMKAMGLYAITHGMPQNELWAAGLGLGVFILICSRAGVIEKIDAFFPQALIRGIQLGLGLLLIKKSYELMRISLSFKGSEIFVLLALLSLILLYRLRKISFVFILFVFAGGILTLFLNEPVGMQSLPPSLFEIKGYSLHWSASVLTLIMIQFPLTLANSILAPALLIKDYFPAKNIRSSQIANSVGCANILMSLFGGMPVCHGAGGLAAQHYYGARTGLSMIFLGALKIAAALFFGKLTLGLAEHFPRTLLGILLLSPAMDLSFQALSKARRALLVTCITAFVFYFFSAMAALVVGLLVHGGIDLMWKPRRVMVEKRR